MRQIHLPMDQETLMSLRMGEEVLLSGTVLTGRDAAHKRLVALVEKGEPLPLELKGQTIYYVGPAPARPPLAVGSAGPTSSYRMDMFTPPLLALGLNGMIGKGRIGPKTLEAMKKHPSIYFAAIGGSAVLISKSIRSVEVVAYPDLGPEAIHRFVIEGFPAVVAVDTLGQNLYEEGPKLYRQTAL